MAQTIDNKIIQPTQQKKGTGFSNIQDIVRANRSNRLGQAVSGGVSNVVGKNQQDLSAAREQFQQGAQQNQLGTAADQAYAQQTIQQAGQGGANPAQADLDRFAKLRAGMYQGPTELGNKEQLMAQGADLKSLGGAAANEYGRRGLLQRFVGPDQYTQGQQRLDNLLLGQTGGQALNQARRQANLYGQQLEQAQQSAGAQAQGLQQQAQQFGQQLQGQLGEAQTQQEQDLANRVSQENQQATAARDILKAILSKPVQPDTSKGGVSTMPVGGLKPSITQAQLDLANPFLTKTGLSDDMLMGLQNLVKSPEEILGQGVNAPTKEQIATEQDKSRAIALAKLAGQNPTLFSEDTQIGGYDPLAFLNKEKYKELLGQGTSKYQAGVKAQGQTKAIQSALAKAGEVERMLRQDAAKQTKYQQDMQKYKNDLAQWQMMPVGTPRPVEPSGSGVITGMNNQARLAQQQKLYDQANKLLKDSGLNPVYAHPGDSGQWQNYQAQQMEQLLKNTTDANLVKQQKQLAPTVKQQQDYARIGLLDQLKGLIK